jgi:hypothetical protein
MRDQRRLTVIRDYQVPVTPGKKTTVAVPAILSFWGATNQQVVLDSGFIYSVKPDSVRVTADTQDWPCRYYELTWNTPNADTLRVTQTLTVEISTTALLHTAATLPYGKDVWQAFAASLESNKTVDLNNPAIEGIAKEISAKTSFAEEAVELACDWVNDHIQFQSGTAAETDTVLSTGQGNCVGMSNLVVAILRKMGIPAETVTAKFIGSQGGHKFVEVYFPDAGWVFYDPANHNRGYKSLDCLMTVGNGFRLRNDAGPTWKQGFFCTEKDVTPYTEDDRVLPRKLRPGPRATVSAATVIRQAPPKGVKVRHQPLRRIILDLSIPPGRREQKPQTPFPQTQPSPGPKPDSPR